MFRQSSQESVLPSRRTRFRQAAFERLEDRCLLAGDSLAAISGTVFVDETDNGLTNDDARLAGVEVFLYRDDNNEILDNALNGLLGSDFTDENGRYEFTGLGSGVYRVEQGPTGDSTLRQRDDQTSQSVIITAGDANGTIVDTIDTFMTEQSVSAPPTDDESSTSLDNNASETIQGARELHATLHTNAGRVRLATNEFDVSGLVLSTTVVGHGTGTVTWDGDADGTLDPRGLGGHDLTAGGDAVGFRFGFGADLQGGEATFRVISASNEVSELTIEIPDTDGTSTLERDILFTDFSGNADFNDVGAIQLVIDGVAALDAQFDRIDKFGPNRHVVNFANLPPEIDLSIEKTDSIDPVIAGESLTYTLTIHNNGPSTATNVLVEDTLPAFVTFASASAPDGGSVGLDPSDDKVVVASFDALAPGESARIIINVDVASNAAGKLLNVAVVSADQQETNLDNNYAEECTFVESDYDLQIVKTDAPDPLRPGEELTYTIVVTNNGPSDSAQVIVSDELPPEVTYKEASTTQGFVIEPSSDSQFLQVDIGYMAVGQSETITVITTVNPDVVAAFENEAVVEGKGVVPGEFGLLDTETNLENNVDDTPTDIILPTSTISGFVYLDLNDSGIFENDESGIANVPVALSGIDVFGNEVNSSTETLGDGSYSFVGLVQGSYTITEGEVPLHVDDGKDTPGEIVGSNEPLLLSVLDDEFAELALGSDEDAVEFNFGELCNIPTLFDFM
jgi:uncharacterized repeat protein (TIGR01451 family)